MTSLSPAFPHSGSTPKRIVLLSCVKSKLSVATRAEALYTSPLFRFSLAYARQIAPDAIFILSAKYGLVSLDQHIAPYEQTLKKMSSADRAEWGQKVLRQLAEVSNPSTDHFTILAGRAYADPLTPALPNHSLPLDGLGQGMRLQFLKSKLSGPNVPRIPTPPALETHSGTTPNTPKPQSIWRRLLDSI